MSFIDTHALAVKEPLPGWKGRFFNSENLTFGYHDVVEGAAIREHEHPNEEVWHVIEGSLEVTVDGVTRVAAAGAVAIVPPNARHAVKALSDGRVIVVDYPLRGSIGGVRLD